jgi:chemotaxis methyl-accepting protein methylase
MPETSPTIRVRWDATSVAPEPTLEDVRAFIRTVAADLDPETRYVRELQAVLDASRDLPDYLARLQNARGTAEFRLDGSRVSAGERGFSWVDEEVWEEMNVFERTLANLVTGETRMMWAGDGAHDFARFAEAVAGTTGPLSILSVPCSTGKEVYSLLIAALRAGREAQAVGVDRQLAYVERARTGRFVAHHRDWQLPDAGDFLDRRGDATVIRPEVLTRCRFVQGDVLTGDLPAGPFDLVSCRNLLGYFRGANLDTAWRNVVRRCRAGGLLLLDPFVTDDPPMAEVPRALTSAGFVRLFPDASYYRAPATLAVI